MLRCIAIDYFKGYWHVYNKILIPLLCWANLEHKEIKQTFTHIETNAIYAQIYAHVIIVHLGICLCRCRC